MSFKTSRLVSLFPDAYAASEAASLLYRLLDAVGAEFMRADAALKDLLKSHWVDYASGPALDGLGSIYGVERRQLPGGGAAPQFETDDAFRLRLRSIVSLFTGGGTRRAVLGAVRSALGLPFDWGTLNLPAGLHQELEDLILLREFSPAPERLVDEITNDADQGQLLLNVPIVSVQSAAPSIEWTATLGGARAFEIELMGSGQGLAADPQLILPQGSTLLLFNAENGVLNAFVGTTNVSSFFHDLFDPTAPARLPAMPGSESQWRFRARGGIFGISAFDSPNTFDFPRYRVDMKWSRTEPLSFDVFVPFFLAQAIDALRAKHHYTGEIFVYEGLGLETIQEVVDRSRAAGVRGSVHFSLNFADDHSASEQARIHAAQRQLEDAQQSEAVVVQSRAQTVEDQALDGRFAIGGIFDMSRFDTEAAFS